VCALTEESDIVNAVLFLLSDSAAMINGVTLSVDGGFSVAWLAILCLLYFGLLSHCLLILGSICLVTITFMIKFRRS